MASPLIRQVCFGKTHIPQESNFGQKCPFRKRTRVRVAVFFVVLSQLLFKLWREQFEQFDIPGHEWCGGIRGTKDDRVARGAPDHLAAEIALKQT